MYSTMLSSLALVFLGAATALNPRLMQRDSGPIGAQPCFNPSSQPVRVDNYECPASNPNNIKMNPDGSCGKITPDGGSPCTQYCEVKLAYFYGPEADFNQQCEAEDPSCQIVDTRGTSVTNTHSFDVGFSVGKRDVDGINNDALLVERGDAAPLLDRVKAAFNFGASWSWSSTTSQATAKTSNKPNNAMDQCGQWIFVPYYITSCGTLTYADFYPEQNVINTGDRDPANHSPAHCGDPKTVPNFCQSAPYLDSEGRAVGETIFQAYDCNTKKPLAFCYQQVPYLHLDVAKTPDMYINYLFAHTDEQVFHKDITSDATDEAINKCLKDEWTGPFHQDPSWVDGDIGHAHKAHSTPSPAGKLAAPTASALPVGTGSGVIH